MVKRLEKSTHTHGKNNGFQTWHLMQTISPAKCICDVKIINLRPYCPTNIFFSRLSYNNMIWSNNQNADRQTRFVASSVYTYFYKVKLKHHAFAAGTLCAERGCLLHSRFRVKSFFYSLFHADLQFSVICHEFWNDHCKNDSFRLKNNILQTQTCTHFS